MFTLKRTLTMLLITVCFLISFAGIAFARFSDTSGHWAENQINEWVSRGFIEGYQDGTFKPDSNITRAEFITLVNKAFGFTESAAVTFSDVSSTDWFVGEIAKAVAAGYLSGYSDGTVRPDNNISRQEATIIIARVLKLNSGDLTNVDKFADAGKVAPWSRAAVSAVVAGGLMSGYPDQTYRPEKSITRAEAVSTLYRAVGKKVPVTTTYTNAGIYGPESGVNTIDGDVVINGAGVTLRNTVINGDLLLAKGIGEGNVNLKNVTVKGTTTVEGGGANSIYAENFTTPELKVKKKGVRIVAQGNTSVNIVTLESGATIVEVSVTGPGFETVVLSQEIPAGEPVILSGNFENVTVSAPNAAIEIIEGSSVNTLTANAPVTVTGEGTINTAKINASGVTIEQTPVKTEVSSGVKANVGGEEVAGKPSSGGGGGGGGSTTPAAKVTAASIRVGSADIAAIVASDGLSGTIDLSSYPNNAKTSRIYIDTAAGSTLNISRVESENLSDVTLNKSFSLPGNISVSQLFTLAEIDLGTMRAVFGGQVTIMGTLSCSGHSSSSVSLTIDLGSQEGSLDNEYVNISVSGNIITADIKPGKENTRLSAIEVTDLLMDTVGEIPEWVRVSTAANSGSISNPGTPDGKTAIINEMVAAIGVAWENATLQDLADNDVIVYFKKSGDTNIFQLKFE